MSAKLVGPKPMVTPGPGKYEPKNVLGVGVAKYTMRARKEPPKKSTGPPLPGPGAYDPLRVDKRKYALFAAKAKDPKGAEYPGPQYNIPEIKAPGVKLGKAQRDQGVPGLKKQISPGPQHVTINIPSQFGNGGKLPNAAKSRSTIIKADIAVHSKKPEVTPSPAAYTPVYPQKKGWSMGARHKQADTTFASSTNPIGFVKTVLPPDDAASV